MWHKFLRAAGSGNSKGGGTEWVIAPSDFFLAPSLALSVFFLISRLSSFGWHMQDCQMRFVKIPVILSTAPDLSYVIIHKRYRENRDNQYCWATVNTLSVFWLIRYISVCARRDNRTKDCVNSRKLTSLKKLSWQDSLQQSLWFEKFCVSFFLSYGKLFYFHNTGFRHWFSKCRSFTSLC